MDERINMEIKKLIGCAIAMLPIVIWLGFFGIVYGWTNVAIVVLTALIGLAMVLIGVHIAVSE
jgi:hypothetical protein